MFSRHCVTLDKLLKRLTEKFNVLADVNLLYCGRLVKNSAGSASLNKTGLTVENMIINDDL